LKIRFLEGAPEDNNQNTKEERYCVTLWRETTKKKILSVPSLICCGREGEEEW